MYVYSLRGQIDARPTCRATDACTDHSLRGVTEPSERRQAANHPSRNLSHFPSLPQSASHCAICLTRLHLGRPSNPLLPISQVLRDPPIRLHLPTQRFPKKRAPRRTALPTPERVVASR